MVFPVGAAIMGGASILGGVLGGKGAKKAAKAQAAAQQKAIDFQKYMYDTSRADLAPWRQAGGAAIGAGAAMLQPGYDHTTSPGYEFRVGEMMDAVEGSAASKGGLLTGGTLKDVMKYANGYAADDFNDQFNRQMAVAAGGQQAATSTGQLGANAASGIGSLMNAQGQAKASGYAGQNQAIQGTLGNLMSIYSMGGFGGGAGQVGGFTPQNLGGGIY